MSYFFEIIKVIILGIVQGVTEWLPVSSTGHLILVNEVIQLKMSAPAMDLFLVLVQLASILAVIILFWPKIWPFEKEGTKLTISKPVMLLWMKIVVASVPAAIVGILWDDFFTEHFYNGVTIAIMLILFGIIFIIVEDYNKKRKPNVTSLSGVTFQTAFIIGIFQMIAAVFPGVSRSGATIIGGLLLGLSRYVAAEFTFFLAIPAMLGASLLKLIKLGMNFPAHEWVIIAIGSLVSFVVSIVVIKFLMNYIKKHDFKVFGWYRIALGILVLLVTFLI